MAQWLREDVANPSSTHAAGRRARDAVEDARAAVAALVGAAPRDVVFTSGGTESNNMALQGRVRPGEQVVSSRIEHASVLRTLEQLEGAGVRVTWVEADPVGRIDPGAVADALCPETRLVSIGWANGELGTVQDMAALGEMVQKHPGAVLHSDAVQAAAHLELDVSAVGVGLVSLSGHKLGAPSGVGALVVRGGTELRPIAGGGPQERERRPGTENVPGIVGFGLAAELARAERGERREPARKAREALWEELRQHAGPVVRFGPVDGLPNTLFVGFPGLTGDALLIALDLAGIAASTGSACAAGAPEPSHVLAAIGADPSDSRGAIRLSFGTTFSESDAIRAGQAVAAVVRRARRG